jgi:MFS family permease
MYSEIATPRERGKYVGMMAGVYSVSVIIGPIVGGALTDNASWRWIFYINLPIGGLAMIVIWFALSKLERVVKNNPKIDWAGTIVIVCAVVALLLPLQWGGDQYVVLDLTRLYWRSVIL